MLDEKVIEAARCAGIEETNEVQRRAIPEILKKKNVLVIAPTGYGKTEAAMLPVLSEALHDESKGVFALYITPLKALNRDMLNRLLKLSVKLDLSIAVRHGDTPTSERSKQMKKPPKLLITTPETLQILLVAKRMKENLRSLRFVIVDEIHELVDSKRGSQLAIALERLRTFCGRDFQMIGLSATVGDRDEVARFLSGNRECSIVEIRGVKKMDVDLMGEFGRPVAMCKKLIDDHDATLLFTNTRESAEMLASEIGDSSIGIHHGSLSREVRIDAEERFKNNALKGLICTSSLELGIDIGRVDFVIQYNSPRQVTRLLQRVGRSMHRRDLISRGAIITADFDELAEAMAINKLARTGIIEKPIIPMNPLDALANQVVAALISGGRANPGYLYDLIRKAYPFSTLQRVSFDRVIDQLVAERLIFLRDDNDLSVRKRGFEYFYTTLSMIPDGKFFSVIHFSTKKRIGTLDESFVSSYIKPQSNFIFRGESWEVVNIEESRVIVEKTNNRASIPSWVGEEIPVPFDVAQEVGRLRRSDERLIECLGEKPETSDTTITIEREGRVVILNCCFGTRINESLSRYLSAIIAREYGESFEMSSDPYRAVINPPRPIASLHERIYDLLHEDNDVKSAIESLLYNTYYFRYVLFHVAKRFGAIRKDTRFRDTGGKILLTFEDTPIYEEALREMFEDRLDVGGCEGILRRIREKDITVRFAQLSKLSEAGLGKGELVSPLRSEKQILELLKKRLDDSKIVLFCLSCRKFKQETKVKRASVSKCPLCGSVRITVIRPWESDILREKSGKKFEEMYKISNLYGSYGKDLLMAIAARGVGAVTAMRMLRSTPRGNEDLLLKRILEAEITYERTREYWD